MSKNQMDEFGDCVLLQSQPDVLDVDECISCYRLNTGVAPGLEIKNENCTSSGYGYANINFPD